MDTPFTTQQLARSPYFTDREREVRRVLEVMRSRDRLVLFGERRMGKSSVIARAAEQLAESNGVVIAADAWTVDDLDGLNRALMHSVPSTWLLGERIQRMAMSLGSLLRVTMNDQGKPEIRLAPSTDRDADPLKRLDRILRTLDEVAREHDGPVAVVIDEFQKVEELQAGSAAGLLRQVVLETPHLAYVFAGSAVGLVTDLIGPKGPFHAMDRLEVKGIDPVHLSTWIRDRFRTHGLDVSREFTDEIYARGGPVTEYVMRLAKVTFRRGSAEGKVQPTLITEAFDEIVADHAGSFELIWGKLSLTKRQVLRAVADGEAQLTSRDVMLRYGIGASSSAVYAIDELRREGLLAPGLPPRVSDPFLAAWLRNQP